MFKASSLQNEVLLRYPFSQLQDMIEKYPQFESLPYDDQFWFEKARSDFGVTEWYWKNSFTVEPILNYLQVLSQKSVARGSENLIEPNLCLIRSAGIANLELFSYFENLIDSTDYYPDYQAAFLEALAEGQADFAQDIILPKSRPYFVHSIQKACESGSEETFLYVWNLFTVRPEMSPDDIQKCQIEALKVSFPFFQFVSRYIGEGRIENFQGNSDDIEQIAKASSVEGIRVIEPNERQFSDLFFVSAYRGALVTEDNKLKEYLISGREGNIDFLIEKAQFGAAAETSNVELFEAILEDDDTAEFYLDKALALAIRYKSYPIIEYVLEVERSLEEDEKWDSDFPEAFLESCNQQDSVVSSMLAERLGIILPKYFYDLILPKANLASFRNIQLFVGGLLGEPNFPGLENLEKVNIRLNQLRYFESVEYVEGRIEEVQSLREKA
nr:hypothetical protein pmam_338 [Pithovirus mammoth]